MRKSILVEGSALVAMRDRAIAGDDPDLPANVRHVALSSFSEGEGVPRYFFHRTDGFVDHDQVGTELDDLNAARAAAVIFTGESLRDRPGYVWNDREFRVEVTDQRGRLLLTVVTFAVEAGLVRTAPDRPEI